MNLAYSFILSLGLLFGSVVAQNDVNSINLCMPSDNCPLGTGLDDLFPEGVDIPGMISVIDKIPEKDLSLTEKLALGWQFAKMQASEHPYYCIAGVTVTAATLAAIIYYARN